MNLDFVSNSDKETIEIGRRIGEQLKGGEVLAICGELGSGKTHLVKGIAAGAGARDAAKAVNSPTFVIVNEYEGRLDIYHIDAYRLNSTAEFEMLGFDDFCYPESVVMIEWADKVKGVLKNIDCVWIELAHAGPTQRAIHIEDVPEHLKVGR